MSFSCKNKDELGADVGNSTIVADQGSVFVVIAAKTGSNSGVRGKWERGWGIVHAMIGPLRGQPGHVRGVAPTPSVSLL
jgi:hypothetical protein